MAAALAPGSPLTAWLRPLNPAARGVHPCPPAESIQQPFARGAAKLFAAYGQALRPRLLVLPALLGAVAAWNSAFPEEPLGLLEQGCLLGGFLSWKVRRACTRVSACAQACLRVRSPARACALALARSCVQRAPASSSLPSLSLTLPLLPGGPGPQNLRGPQAQAADRGGNLQADGARFPPAVAPCLLAPAHAVLRARSPPPAAPH